MAFDEAHDDGDDGDDIHASSHRTGLQFGIEVSSCLVEEVAKMGGAVCIDCAWEGALQAMIGGWACTLKDDDVMEDLQRIVDAAMKDRAAFFRDHPEHAPNVEGKT